MCVSVCMWLCISVRVYRNSSFLAGRAYAYTCIHTYEHKCIHTYVHMYFAHIERAHCIMHIVCTHTQIRVKYAGMHTYISTYMHTDIDTYIHYPHMFKERVASCNALILQHHIYKTHARVYTQRHLFHTNIHTSLVFKERAASCIIHT